jgi:hypothetical protein
MSLKPIKESALGAILAIELELNMIEQDIEAIDHDLDFLTGYKENLIYNRIFLRKEKVVTSLFEYKKTIKELLQVETKLMELRNLSNKTHLKMDQKLKALEHYQNLWEQEEIIESEKILLFIRNSHDK